jgi:hypothetical protein
MRYSNFHLLFKPSTQASLIREVKNLLLGFRDLGIAGAAGAWPSADEHLAALPGERSSRRPIT